MDPVVIGVSGASGAILAVRLVHVLTQADIFVDLVATGNAAQTFKEEIQSELPMKETFFSQLSMKQRLNLQWHESNDFSAKIASGSYQTHGMVVVPCSMATVAAISMGLSDNLLRRAADVTIKEGRRLIIVPRETPMSEIHLEHLHRLARFGVKIVPPVPGWYTRPQTVEEIELFIVGKIIDQLKISMDIYPRWKGKI